eukprot:5770420-Heterocapsa_arctica.AAC.1
MDVSVRQKHWYGKWQPGTSYPAYIDCSNCYELVKHSVAAKAAVDTECNSTVVKLSFGMYKNDRLTQ